VHTLVISTPNNGMPSIVPSWPWTRFMSSIVHVPANYQRKNLKLWTQCSSASAQVSCHLQFIWRIRTSFH
jgi:hypothetical protein